jgi:hypothetical protein
VLPSLACVRLSAYFCNAGLISFLSVFLTRGKSAEVRFVGKEGFVGVPLIAGFRSAVTRAIVQIEGSALRIEADTFADYFFDSRAFSSKSMMSIKLIFLTPSRSAARINSSNFFPASSSPGNLYRKGPSDCLLNRRTCRPESLLQFLRARALEISPAHILASGPRDGLGRIEVHAC